MLASSEVFIIATCGHSSPSQDPQKNNLNCISSFPQFLVPSDLPSNYRSKRLSRGHLWNGKFLWGQMRDRLLLFDFGHPRWRWSHVLDFHFAEVPNQCDFAYGLVEKETLWLLPTKPNVVVVILSVQSMKESSNNWTFQ